MAQGIPEEVVDEIRQRTDLVGLVGEYINLERRGKNMVGLCPFHSEKTPSFSVSPEKQLYHCFGCGTSGNIFNFVMQLDRLTFTEAASLLARRAGVVIPQKKVGSPGEESLKDKIYKVNHLAARFYAYCLHKTGSGEKALDYLQKRGITRETSELFMLGYAPPDWQGFYNFARKKGVGADLMVKAGLVSPGKEKGYYDRFRDRLIMPILNPGGEVSGFGGRLLAEGGKDGPKYLNSPQTPVFDKGAILFGMNLARDEIRREKKAVVMEGYTDVISAHQAGIKNAVASLGTALTAEQARLLRYQAETVITAYDADSAGEAATWRGLAILQSSGCLVMVAELPEGSDPDDLIREKGADAFLEFIDKATPLMEYRLEKLKNKYDLVSDRGRINYIEELIPFLYAAVNQVEQDYYLKRAAEELFIDEDALRSELKKRRRQERAYREKGLSAGRADDPEVRPEIAIRPAEKILVSLMLQSKEIAEQGRSLIEPESLGNDTVRAIFKEIWDLFDREVVPSAEKVLNRFEDQRVVNLISEAVTDPALQELTPDTAKRMAEDCFNQLHKAWYDKRLKELQKKIRDTEKQGSKEQIAALMREHRGLLDTKYSRPYRLEKGGDFGD